MLSLKRFHNPLHHIRDPALFLSDFDEKRPEVSAYNVHVDLAARSESADCRSSSPSHGWTSSRASELTAYLGLGVWYSRDHQRLFPRQQSQPLVPQEGDGDGKSCWTPRSIDFQKAAGQE